MEGTRIGDGGVHSVHSDHPPTPASGLPPGSQGTPFDNRWSWKRRRGVKQMAAVPFQRRSMISGDTRKVGWRAAHRVCPGPQPGTGQPLLCSVCSHSGQRDRGHTETQWEGILAARALSWVGCDLAKPQLPGPKHAR